VAEPLSLSCLPLQRSLAGVGAPSRTALREAVPDSPHSPGDLAHRIPPLVQLAREATPGDRRKSSARTSTPRPSVAPLRAAASGRPRGGVPPRRLDGFRSPEAAARSLARPHAMRATSSEQRESPPPEERAARARPRRRAREAGRELDQGPHGRDGQTRRAGLVPVPPTAVRSSERRSSPGVSERVAPSSPRGGATGVTGIAHRAGVRKPRGISHFGTGLDASSPRGCDVRNQDVA
jgi:hypothetical protein